MTVVLRGLTWEHERGYGSVAASAMEYASVVSDVEVRWEARSLLSFGDQPLGELVDGVDLLVIDHPHVPLAAADGLLMPLDGSGHDDELGTLSAESIGPSHRSYQYGGRQWGLATDAAAQVAAWRPDLLSAAPQTWPEVLELAAEGRVLWPLAPVDAFSSLVTIAASLGSPPMQRPDEFLPREDARRALELMRRLRRLVPRDNTSLNPIVASDRLATGDRFVYCPLLFGYSNYSREGFRDHRLAYTDIPATPSGLRVSLLGGAGIAVSARTAHPDEAIAHAFWLASARVQGGVYFDGGGQPGNARAWDSPRVNGLTMDFFRATRATLEDAYLRPRHPGYPEMQNGLGIQVTAALDDEITDDDLIDHLNDGVARHLSGHHAHT